MNSHTLKVTKALSPDERRTWRALKRTLVAWSFAVALWVFSATGAQAATSQTITFPELPARTASDTSVQLNATASSGLTVTYAVVGGTGIASVTDNTVTLSGSVGTVTVRASQAGNASYSAAPDVYNSFQVMQPGLPRVTQIAMGSDFAIMVKDDGTLWGWGSGMKAYPVQIGTATNWKLVAAGDSNCLALKTDGTLWSWSNGGTPLQIGTATDWVAIGAGLYHSLAVKSDGTLWAWGNNLFGQLGDGTTVTKSSPIQIGTETNWKSVTGGQYYTVALKTDGTLWAWGNNSWGNLGNGTHNSTSTPAQIGTSTDWTSVVSGQGHVLATKSDGTVWGWGWNNNGQLGDGSTGNRLAPVQIGINNCKAITAGYTHTVAIKNDGTLWAWGDNNFGMLGDGTTTQRTSPVQIGTSNCWLVLPSGMIGSSKTVAAKNDGTLWSWGCNNVYNNSSVESKLVNGPRPPVRVDTALGLLSSVAAGTMHSAVIKSDGTLWTCGYNLYGQLGNNTTADKTSPVQVGTSANWKSVTAGGSHTAALQTDGTLWAWGYNYYGQVGDGTTTNKTSPVQIGVGTDWKSVSGGGNHTIALKNNGTLWAWGLNTSGQLGDGTKVNEKSPVQIGGDTNWKFAAAGNSYSVALKTDGTLWVWGSRNGQLSPTQIGTANDWKSVSAGAYHIMALKTDGTLWALGDNSFGQLGDGSTTTRNNPVQIAIASRWKSVRAGQNHTAALKTDGTLWTWGNNYYGQLGDGTTTQRTSPVQVGFSNAWAALADGGVGASDGTIAFTADGTLWGFGYNGHLQMVKVGINQTFPEVVLPALTPQTIVFPAVSLTQYGIPVSLAAVAQSGLPVSYAVAGPATLSGNQLTVTGPGRIDLFAFQDGDQIWNSTGPVSMPIPQIAVQDGGTVPATSLVSGSGSVSLGPSNVTGSTTRTFTLMNIGTTDLTGVTVTVDGANSGDFTVSQPPSSTVAMGGSTSFIVTFAPTAFGLRNAALHITSNAQADPSFLVALTGYGNTPPQINGLAPQIIAINTATPALAFQVGDTETTASALVVSADSSNAQLVPNNNIALSGSGNNRTVTVIPATDQLGSTLITLMVSDEGGLTASTALSLTVQGTPLQAWRQQYFGSAANTGAGADSADPTGCGQNNIFKYVAGLNPTDKTAVFHVNVQTVAAQPGQMQIIFSPVLLDRTYTVLYKTSMTDSAWTPLTGATQSDNGQQRTVTDTSAAGKTKFYKVQISKP